MNDLRNKNHSIVVNTSGARDILPLELPPPGIVFKPAQANPRETTTWYVPEPLIKLMQYCLANQTRP